MDFKDKVVVVTGSSAGLGRDQAEAFAKEGATVAVLGTDVERTNAVAAGIRANGGAAGAYLIDVGTDASVQETFSRIIADHGGVDVLMNNAGFAYGDIYNLTTLPIETLHKAFEVNVYGVIYCARAARASMAARGGGVIINISSLSSFLPSGAYAVTKAAVNSITVSLAAELSPDKTRVVGIAPGMMETDNAMDALPGSYRDAYRRTQLAGRAGAASDISDAALFLASDKAGFITGQTLLIDGGFLINAPKMVGK